MKADSDRRPFLLLLGILGAALVVLVALAPGAAATLALSFGLAYLANPAVEWLEKRRMSRPAAALTVICLIAGVILIMLVLLVPYLLSQGIAFLEDLPELVETSLERISQWPLWERLGVTVPANLTQAMNELSAGVGSVGLDALKGALSALLGVTSGIMGVILSLVKLVIIPVFVFFFLKDFTSLKESFYEMLPESRRKPVGEYVAMVDDVLSGFIRGQIIVALSLAVLYSAGLTLTGIRFGFLIGVVAGLLFIIPYVGTLIGIVASAVVLIVDFSGWGQVFGVAATFAVAQAIEGYVLTPRIVGNRVGLNQLETLAAILVGGEAAGFAGMVLAIPGGGILKKSFGLFLRSSRGSGEEPPNSEKRKEER
jgi:predicted PurR-regulated permease PerM